MYCRWSSRWALHSIAASTSASKLRSCSLRIGREWRQRHLQNGRMWLPNARSVSRSYCSGWWLCGASSTRTAGRSSCSATRAATPRASRNTCSIATTGTNIASAALWTSCNFSARAPSRVNSSSASYSRATAAWRIACFSCCSSTRASHSSLRSVPVRSETHWLTNDFAALCDPRDVSVCGGCRPFHWKWLGGRTPSKLRAQRRARRVCPLEFSTPFMRNKLLAYSFQGRRRANERRSSRRRNACVCVAGRVAARFCGGASARARNASARAALFPPAAPVGNRSNQTYFEYIEFIEPKVHSIFKQINIYF